MPDLPTAEESFVLMTNGKFASVSFLLAVADKEPIRDCCISTFRVGKKEALALKRLHEAVRLERCRIIVSGLMGDGEDQRYTYYRTLVQVCEACGFDLRGLQNHSKVTLMRTDCNWYVLETSSNLNETPNIEQFRFENDEQLFEFYKQNLFEKGEK